MTNHEGTDFDDQPTSVVGPITLGRGRPALLPPNSVISAFMLGAALGASGELGLIEVSSDAGGVEIAITVDGAPETITVSGLGGGPAVAYPPGATLFAIARTEDQLVVLSAGGADATYVPFPLGSGAITVTVGS
jgi:hypothetical protein